MAFLRWYDMAALNGDIVVFLLLKPTLSNTVNNLAYSIFYKGEHIQFTYGNMVPVGGVHRHRIYS